MIAALASAAPSHVSSGGRTLVPGAFVAVVVIAIIVALWLRSSRDDD